MQFDIWALIITLLLILHTDSTQYEVYPLFWYCWVPREEEVLVLVQYRRPWLGDILISLEAELKPDLIWCQVQSAMGGLPDRELWMTRLMKNIAGVAEAALSQVNISTAGDLVIITVFWVSLTLSRVTQSTFCSGAFKAIQSYISYVLWLQSCASNVSSIIAVYCSVSMLHCDANSIPDGILFMSIIGLWRKATTKS